jgi:hypothetical protein
MVRNHWLPVDRLDRVSGQLWLEHYSCKKGSMLPEYRIN